MPKSLLAVALMYVLVGAGQASAAAPTITSPASDTTIEPTGDVWEVPIAATADPGHTIEIKLDLISPDHDRGCTAGRLQPSPSDPTRYTGVLRLKVLSDCGAYSISGDESVYIRLQDTTSNVPGNDVTLRLEGTPEPRRTAAQKRFLRGLPVGTHRGTLKARSVNVGAQQFRLVVTVKDDARRGRDAGSWAIRGASGCSGRLIYRGYSRGYHRFRRTHRRGQGAEPCQGRTAVGILLQRIELDGEVFAVFKTNYDGDYDGSMD